MKRLKRMMWTVMFILGPSSLAMADRTAGENIDDATLATRTKRHW